MPPKHAKAPLQQLAVGTPMERIAIVGRMPEPDRGNPVIVVMINCRLPH